MRAFSAVAGSWNTTEITRPMRRRCAAERFVTSSPLKNTLPDVGCCKPHITLAVVDLPQPDSPTMPKVSPGMSLRVRPRTACTLFGCRMEPVRVLNVTRDVVEEDDGGGFARSRCGLDARVHAFLLAHMMAPPGTYGLMPRRLSLAVGQLGVVVVGVGHALEHGAQLGHLVRMAGARREAVALRGSLSGWGTLPGTWCRRVRRRLRWTATEPKQTAGVFVHGIGTGCPWTRGPAPPPGRRT